MFSKALADKAMTDPLWRRNTALGRKVSSKIIVHDSKDLFACPYCGNNTSNSGLCNQCKQETLG